MIADTLRALLVPDGYKAWLAGLRVELLNYGRKDIVIVGLSDARYKVRPVQGRTKSQRSAANHAYQERIHGIRVFLQEKIDAR